MSMEAIKKELIESASVSWSKTYQKWSARGELNIGSYVVSIEVTYHDDFDTAAQCLKKAMAKAVVVFDGFMKEI